jgi:signal peptidase II
MTARPNYLILVIVSLLSLAMDQMTKVYIDRVMDLHQSIPVIPNLFSITYVRNKGAAFGFLANTSFRIPFFIFITVVAVFVILFAYRKLRADQKLAMVSLSMILSGALGNLIDRVRNGEVIDFLDVYWKSYHWPAFNIADSAICVGVFLLAIDMLREERRQKMAQEDSPS